LLTLQILQSIYDILQTALLYDEDAALIFTQMSFWIFFSIVLLGYSFLYNRAAMLKSVYLLAVSIFFYYKASGMFFVLLLSVTIANYLFAFCIASGGGIWKKIWLIIIVTINLLLLAYFKYADFFIQTLNDIFSIDLKTENIFANAINNFTGVQTFDASRIILPIGISFYIFQALSYVIDIYRNKIFPVRNLIHFSFYLSFFPQLVAGPIVRANEFIPQIYKPYNLNAKEFWNAVLLIMCGLTKKIIVSDYIAFNYVDRIFDAPTLYSGVELVMGVYGYAIQIYCDFSGYTDIAIGIAKMLGYHLPVNFNVPYASHSVTNFWRRWHISLSMWLRDYLYIPLGGSRHGKHRTHLNLLITMLLGGLWHGAAFKFIVWGGLHGIMLVVERHLKRFSVGRKYILRLPNIVRIFITFHIICLFWIIFRADSIDMALTFIQQMFERFDIYMIPDIFSAYSLIFIMMGIAYVFHFLPNAWKEWLKDIFFVIPVGIKIIIIVILIFLMMQISTAATQPFIYFQF
jgi:D-alanyl-lipoteichoic acid acyltransferase DltB (MBOAT superfamily)